VNGRTKSFRADSLEGALGLVRKLAFQAPEVVTLGMVLAVAIVAGNWLAQLYDEFRDTEATAGALAMPLEGLADGVAFAVIAIFNSNGAEPFIYFRF
jgi:hypothetical protein